jgi:hypothetical protein
VIAEIISKRERPPFFESAALDHVHVMTVRPSTRPVEEGTERVVLVWHVNVAD